MVEPPVSNNWSLPVPARLAIPTRGKSPNNSYRLVLTMMSFEAGLEGVVAKCLSLSCPLVLGRKNAIYQRV